MTQLIRDPMGPISKLGGPDLVRRKHLMQYWPDPGFAFLPFEFGFEYKLPDYWTIHTQKDESLMGKKLTRARTDLVDQYTNDCILDVGIGGGRFLRERSSLGCMTLGYDIHRDAIDWLQKKNLWIDISERDEEEFPGMTMWDVLEHIPDPGPYFHVVKQWLFVSMPIYDTLDDIQQSKHFKPNEHCWYFTEKGLIEFMSWYGFNCRKVDPMESDLGRDSVLSFVFERATST